VLIAARTYYEQAGFRLVLEEPNNEFGKELIAETWEINLLNRSSSTTLEIGNLIKERRVWGS